MKILGSLLLIFFTFFLVKKEKSNNSALSSERIIQDTLIVDSLKKVIDSSLNNHHLQDSIEKIDSVKIKASKFLQGIASFYSRNLEGTETATGEIFKHDSFTAASNRFKLNTWLRVTRLSNGKSIIVRINDRMHPRMDRKGRIVDLTIKGAKNLGFFKFGLTKVKVEVVPKGTLK